MDGVKKVKKLKKKQQKAQGEIYICQNGGTGMNVGVKMQNRHATRAHKR